MAVSKRVIRKTKVSTREVTKKISPREVKRKQQIKNITKNVKQNQNYKAIKTAQKQRYFENLVDSNTDRNDMYDNVYFNLFNRLPKSTSQSRKMERRQDLRRYRRTGMEPKQELTLNDKIESILNEDFLIKKIYHKLFKEPLPSSTKETDIQTRTILTNTKPVKVQINRNTQDKLLLDFNIENPNLLDIELNAKKASEESFVTVVDDTFTEFIPKRTILTQLDDNQDSIEDLSLELKSAQAQVNNLTKSIQVNNVNQQKVINALNNQVNALSKPKPITTEKPNFLAPFGPISEDRFFSILYQEYKANPRIFNRWGYVNWGQFAWNVKKYSLWRSEKDTETKAQLFYERYGPYILGLFKGYNLAPDNALIRKVGGYLGDYGRTLYNRRSTTGTRNNTITSEYGYMIGELKKLK